MEYSQTETVYFDDLVFTLDESTANNINGGISIAGDVAYSSIPSMYWGAYNSNDGVHYLQINNGTSIAFRGTTETGLEILCNHNKVKNVYFYPAATNSDNFSVTYDEYIKINDSTIDTGDITIGDRYNKNTRSFAINYITYYYQ